MTAVKLQAAGLERSVQAVHRDGHPLSYSASSVWGLSTPFRLQIEMIPRREEGFGTPQDKDR
jgi:hypothetical protein